jgi:hypothetical protein
MSPRARIVRAPSGGAQALHRGKKLQHIRKILYNSGGRRPHPMHPPPASDGVSRPNYFGEGDLGTLHPTFSHPLVSFGCARPAPRGRAHPVPKILLNFRGAWIPTAWTFSRFHLSRCASTRPRDSRGIGSVCVVRTSLRTPETRPRSLLCSGADQHALCRDGIRS